MDPISLWQDPEAKYAFMYCLVIAFPIALAAIMFCQDQSRIKGEAMEKNSNVQVPGKGHMNTEHNVWVAHTGPKLEPEVCKHPADKQYTWFVNDLVLDDQGYAILDKNGDIQFHRVTCACCCQCGSVLSGGA